MGKTGCSGDLGRRQVSVALVATVLLPSSLNSTEAGARDAAHSHQAENKQEKCLAGVELSGSVWGQSD